MFILRASPSNCSSHRQCLMSLVVNEAVTRICSRKNTPHMRNILLYRVEKSFLQLFNSSLEISGTTILQETWSAVLLLLSFSCTDEEGPSFKHCSHTNEGSYWFFSSFSELYSFLLCQLKYTFPTDAGNLSTDFIKQRMGRKPVSLPSTMGTSLSPERVWQYLT